MRSQSPSLSYRKRYLILFFIIIIGISYIVFPSSITNTNDHQPLVIKEFDAIKTPPVASTTTTPTIKTDNLKHCYENRESNENFTLLEDIMMSDRKPTPGRTILFHETSCLQGEIKLNARQACAIESAAKMNPDWDVFVLFASPVGFPVDDDESNVYRSIVKALQRYSNIYFRNVDLWSYAEGSALDKFGKDLLFHTFYVNHISDYLRFVSLYKWGGTYLDMDVVVMKSFSDIPPNYAGAESGELVAAGIINFEHNGMGHSLAEKCVRDFNDNFNDYVWGNNAPGVITRVLNNICHTKQTELMTRSRCNGFHVYPANVFYPIYYTRWRSFFDTNNVNATMKEISESIIIHVWNKLSKNERIRVGSRVVYGLLAEQYCPYVYSSCGDYF